MALSISVSVTGNQSFMQKLTAFSTGLTSFKEALTEVGNALTDYYSGQVFESWGAQFGTPWAQLAPSTLAFKAKHYYQYAAIPLIASGTMRRSFRSTPGALSLIIDNTSDYFKYHQSSDPRHRLPRRQMLGADEGVKDIIKQIITKDVHKKLGYL